MAAGQLFTHIYLDRGAPTRDSERFRNRIAAYYVEHRVDKSLSDLDYRFAKALERELGISVPSHTYGWEPDKVFRKGELRDVLNGITLLYRVLPNDSRQLRAQWHDFVARALREENVGYRVDELCGVHYHVDEEFERNRASTLTVLEAQSLAGSRAAFEDAYRHLDSAPPDTKAAARSIFEALEIVAKQICPGQKNLNCWLAKNTLKEKCLASMTQEATEQAVAAGMFDSLGEWVEVLHKYRHGQPADVPVAPSIELTTFVLSSGSAHLRMLAQCLLRM